MKVDSKTLTGEVYKIDGFGGVNGTWVWDFGVMTLIGNEEVPYGYPNNMDTFGAVVSEMDVDSFEDLEPEKTVDVEFFVGDYTIYTRTSDDELGDFAISPEGDIYKVEVNSATLEGEEIVVVELNDVRNKETQAIRNSEFKENWIPVREIS